MDKIIATIVIVVLTLGLISYAIVGQIGGVKEAGDQIGREQSKINALISNPDLVTGTTVINYIKQRQSANYEISVQNESGAQIDINEINESDLFKMEKYYDEEGNTKSITFIKRYSE